MERYVCIHGHFYQPPRENAWLEQIELQDEAYPYHDWNERITAECYAPNAVSRILDREGFITRVTNNYARISFDFGPTLLVWLEKYAPDVYQAVLDADRESKGRFSGHGSALAQAYNHMIMPLANRHDKYTQVRWGIRDFERRFGRRPEGMWLPETAVDLESLDIMAELGIQFTILAPRQASRVRKIRGEAWEDVSGGHIDSTMAYTLNTPSGRKLSIFFYDDPISRAVAFEGLLSDGETFAHRLTDAFSKEHDGSQFVNIATDGETYGHHHRFGDMALAFALHHIESNNLAQITNYGGFLEKHPPTHEVEIFENTSWSCVHGIERWRSDCGCNTGAHPKWNQAWRAPLRQAMDWLRDAVAPQYEEKARQFVKDPWVARDDYINVILDRTPENVQKFLSQHATRELSDSERVALIKLLELQRHAMLMYTSCGWFFDELSSIGTVQVIQYAGRVVQLAGELFGDNTELHFLELLALAKSNIQELGDGRIIYEKSVKPAMVDLIKLTAHYAISSLFEDYGKQVTIYCYSIDVADYQSVECGHTRLAVGKVTVTSEITQESDFLSFGVLHSGDHNVNAGIREYQGDEAYQVMVQETTKTCAAADFPEVIRLLDKHFGTSTYSLRDLFQDEQRKVLDYVLESALVDIETAFRQLYERHYPPMRFLTDLGHPLPKAFHAAAEFIINADLRRALSGDVLEAERIQNLLDEANVWNIELDNEGLAYLFQQSLGGLMRRFKDSPEDIDLLKELVDLVSLARSMPLTVDLWEIQNLYYEMLRATYPKMQNRAQSGDDAGIEWVTQFVELGQHLRIRVG